MAFLILPHRWRHQPQGAVQIDWGHPISRGLVFAIVPTTMASLDLIGQNKVAATTVTGGTGVSAGPGGVGVDSVNTSTGGWGVAYQPSIFRTIGTEFTISVSADIRATITNSKLVCVPFYSNVWDPPYQSLSLGRSGSTDQLGLFYGATSGGTASSAVFPEGSFGLGMNQRFIASRSGSNATALFNGTRFEPSSNNMNTAAVGWGSGGRVSLLNRNSGSLGEGTDGRLYHAFIWNRALSEAEQVALDENPYQIFRPVPARLYYEPGVAASSYQVFGSVTANKPTLTAGITAGSANSEFTNEFTNEFGTTGGATDPAFTAIIQASKPILAAAATQSFPARSAAAVLSAKKPTLAATATHTFAARAVATVITAKKPAISATATQTTIQARAVSAALVAAKPTIAAISASPSPRNVSAALSAPRPGIKAMIGAVRLAVHSRAPSWRTVNAGTGAVEASWAAPLDPNALLDFTADWNMEMADDTISAAFVQLSGQAAAAGVVVHAESHDTDSITLWLKVDPSFQGGTSWSGPGENHKLRCRVATQRGRIHDRTFGLTVRHT